MKNASWCFIGFALILTLSFCKKDTPAPEKPISFELKIYSFKFQGITPEINGTIDTVSRVISASVPRTADIKKLTPVIEYTEGATLNPPSGFPYNFSQPLEFKLTKNDSTVSYTVNVDYALSTGNQLIKVKFPELLIEKAVSQNNFQVDFNYGTDLTNLLVEFTVSDYATTIPAGNSRINLTQPLQIKVIAENGSEQIYTMEAKVAAQETAVRAFWVPAPWHSNFLRSYQDIVDGVALAKSLKFNTLFICAWAQNKILYPSQTLLDNSSYTSHSEAGFWSTTPYTGGSGDALNDVIQVAHANNIKVILWYEYGFMARNGSAPTPQNNPILAVHPDWVGIDNAGNPSNYNGTDFYFNAYHEDVHQFMIDMIMEAVNNYDIDGIQGDDRMPAMPRNSGYDTYTVNKYKSEHGGQDPPSSYNNSDWVRWRADILNNFWKDVFNTVKSAKSNCLVACSPNPYPWAFDNLMQDWPAWLRDGSVELLSVQCYRTDVSSYKYTIDQVYNYFTANGSGDLKRLVPGMLLYGSSGMIDPAVLTEQLKYNRQKGISGESFFYDVPLKNADIQNVIKAIYTSEALFPDFSARKYTIYGK
jgi:uncharacterized lipoprotein YddW (UPF0748 family)